MWLIVPHYSMNLAHILQMRLAKDLIKFPGDYKYPNLPPSRLSATPTWTVVIVINSFKAPGIVILSERSWHESLSGEICDGRRFAPNDHGQQEETQHTMHPDGTSGPNLRIRLVLSHQLAHSELLALCRDLYCCMLTWQWCCHAVRQHSATVAVAGGLIPWIGGWKLT